MKIQHATNHKKIIVLSLVLVAILTAGLASAYSLKQWPFAPNIDSSVNLQEATLEEIEAGNQIKQQSVNQAAKDKTASGSDAPEAAQPIEGSDKKSVNMEITAINQLDSTLQIRALVQAVSSSGSCTLSMSGPLDKKYTSTANIQPLPSSSTCKGFDIPLDQLTPGRWSVTVDFTNDNLTASAGKEITIK